MIHKDVLIVGQGLAGSALSWHLSILNKDILVINNSKNNISSSVSGGLFNPITGRKLQKTWLADSVFPFLENFYTSIEKKTNSKFFHKKNIIKPLVNNQEYDYFRNQNFDNKYIDIKKNIQNEFLKTKNGYVVIKNAGFIDTNAFLKVIKKYLSCRDSYLEGNFCFNALKYTNTNFVEYKGILAKKIIFCEGCYGYLNPFFSSLPFRLVKGQLIEGFNKSIDIENILNKNIFILNDTMAKKILIGSNYEHIPELWEKRDPNFFHHIINNLNICQDVNKKILDKANKYFNLDIEIKKFKIGIRPATRTIRPFIGFHPKFPQIGIFNGLGSKGVSLVPYLAKCFVDNIYNITSIYKLPEESFIANFL